VRRDYLDGGDDSMMKLLAPMLRFLGVEANSTSLSLPNFLLILIALIQCMRFSLTENRTRGGVPEQRGRKFGCARDDKGRGGVFSGSALFDDKGRVARLCQLVVVVMAFLACGRAHAATCPISAGASQATVQSTLNSCGSGNTASFATGTYSFSSAVSVPCGVSLAGPTVAWPGPYTATLNFSGNNVPFRYPGGCSTAVKIEYLNWNGGIPSPDGGQVLYFPAGTSNVTISYNYFHGNQGSTSAPNSYDGLVYFDGNSGSSVDNNITVSWNTFGQTSMAACSNLMTAYYNGLSGNGGYCVGLGLHNGFNNLLVSNNIFQFMEQGAKVFENQGECVSCVFQYNDFNNIHRIEFETQANIGGSQPTSMTVQYNSLETQYDTNFGSWGLSVANGCPSGCVTNTNYNVLINNEQATGGGGTYTPGAIEMWGSNGTGGNYNLIQGLWANGIMIATTGQFVLNNNTFCMTFGGSTTPNGSGGYFNNEDGPSHTASASGNTFTTASCPKTSVAPTISPASGSFTTSQTVTFTNPGTNRDANTGIWYTTDGSTPVPGAGTAQYIASGGTIAVSTTTTVKAVGMWGAQNQPTSYPSGFGYVPSAVQSATYTAGTSPTLNSVSLTAAGLVTSITVGGSVQINAACHYNNGSTTGCNTTDAYGNSVSTWNTSNAGIVSLSSSGLAGGAAIGTANLTAVVAGVTSPAFALGVTAASVTLSSVSLATTGGITSLVAGQTNQLAATCHYSDGTTTSCTTTDSHGNAVSTWSSSATTIATVSSGGLVTGVAAGSTNLSAAVAGITSSPLLALTVIAAPPTLTGGYLGTPGSANTMTVGGTLQFSAYCQYSNSTTTNCSVADIYGNAVTQWLSSNTGEVTIGAPGSANPGLATAVAVGSPNIQAYVGAVRLNEWVLYISAPAVSLTGVSLATTGGVTGLFVGQTNQLIATCTYSDGSTTNCTTTDSHGNVAGTYSSSSGSHATVGASTGLVTGVATGTTNLTAKAGTFTSPALPLSVLAVPTGIYTITISGPVRFSGSVRF
jgi:hypothetical protein